MPENIWTTVYASKKPITECLTIILRPQDGLSLNSLLPATLMEDIFQAAHLTPTEIKETILRTRNNQNIAAITTFRPSAHDKLLQLKQITVQGSPHPVTCYPSAPTNSCKGVVHGIPALTSTPQLLDKLVSPGPEILTARMMGKTETAIITFEGTHVPFQVLYNQAEYRCRPHRPKSQLCNICLKIGHRADVCPNKSSKRICNICSSDITLLPPEATHECTPYCVNCDGNHPPTEAQCPARLRANAEVTKAAYLRRLKQRQPLTPPDLSKDPPQAPGQPHTSQSQAGRIATQKNIKPTTEKGLGPPKKSHKERQARPKQSSPAARRSHSLDIVLRVSEPLLPTTSPSPITSSDAYKRALMNTGTIKPATSQSTTHNTHHNERVQNMDLDQPSPPESPLNQILQKLDSLEERLNRLEQSHAQLQTLLHSLQKRKATDSAPEPHKSSRNDSISSNDSEHGDL